MFFDINRYLTDKYLTKFGGATPQKSIFQGLKRGRQFFLKSVDTCVVRSNGLLLSKLLSRCYRLLVEQGKGCTVRNTVTVSRSARAKTEPKSAE